MLLFNVTNYLSDIVEIFNLCAESVINLTFLLFMGCVCV